jgi:hypothetical protein
LKRSIQIAFCASVKLPFDVACSLVEPVELVSADDSVVPVASEESVVLVSADDSAVELEDDSVVASEPEAELTSRAWDELVSVEESVVELDDESVVAVDPDVENPPKSSSDELVSAEDAVAEPSVEVTSQPSSDEELVSSVVELELDVDGSVCAVLGSDDPDVKPDELVDWPLTLNAANAATTRVVDTFILLSNAF